MQPCWSRILLAFLCSTPTPTQAQHQYDYIIVGGGTSGLALANRLSEDANLHVAIVEAEQSVLDNKRVQDPQVFFQGGTPSLHWNYTSIQQHHLGHRIINTTAAKALGGTSVINGMTYLRAEKAQLDGWESLGNPNWTWDKLLPYYIKSEHLTLRTAGETYNAVFHGFDGPLHTGWPVSVMRGPTTTIINETWKNIGLPYNPDANSGEMRGFVVWPLTVNPITGIREDAARAYYHPSWKGPTFTSF